MRKSFIILSSSVKLKRLRKIKSSIKRLVVVIGHVKGGFVQPIYRKMAAEFVLFYICRTSRPILGQKRSESRSVVIISDEPTI